MPINQLVNNYQNKVIQIKVNLDIGVEKPQNRFKKGDIAFAPMTNSIYIFLADYNNNQPLSHVGFIKIDAIWMNLQKQKQEMYFLSKGFYNFILW